MISDDPIEDYNYTRCFFQREVPEDKNVLAGSGLIVNIVSKWTGIQLHIAVGRKLLTSAPPPPTPELVGSSYSSQPK